MRYGSCCLNLPQNGSLPRGGEPGWGQGYKFQKTYAFAWFGKRSNTRAGLQQHFRKGETQHEAEGEAEQARYHEAVVEDVAADAGRAGGVEVD